jgi:hypothetical protein
MVKYPIVIMFIMVGYLAMQAIIVSVMFNTLISLRYANDVLNVTVDMANAYIELQFWSLFVSIWLVIIHIAVMWYIMERLDRRLTKKWPDEDLSLRRTERIAYKRRSA